MTAIFQSHLISFRSDIYKFGFMCVLGISATTLYSIFINSKINYIIKDNNFKHSTMITKLEQLSNKISNLTYEREQLLDRILSFKQIKDSSDEPSKNITCASTHNENTDVKAHDIGEDDFAYGFYDNIPW